MVDIFRAVRPSVSGSTVPAMVQAIYDVKVYSILDVGETPNSSLGRSLACVLGMYRCINVLVYYYHR